VRTTIELPNESRARLLALAARRGLRGYSDIVREAVDRYLVEEERKEMPTSQLLELSGCLSDEEADRALKRIKETWKRWR